MKQILLCTILLICSGFLFGQVTLSGSVTGKDNKPAFEALILLYSSDTVLIKTEVIDEAGLFQFQVEDNQRYYLQVTADEYITYFSELIPVNGATSVAEIKLFIKESNLGEVEVVAKKPYLERQPGKLILNVESSINSTGSSAFELLEKAPAVRINNNDVITLSGKSGIVVQIDGKSLPMSGTDLGNYLRGIPSSSIEKIELISNPSSKYDAAGSAIINIKLKKDTRLGTNGTIALGYGQGVYPKMNSGIGLNHRTKRVNIYGSYNYAYRKAFNHLVLERRFYQNDTFQGAYIQDNYLKFPFNNHIVRAGVDFNINKKNSISFVVNGNSNQFKQQGFNSSDVQGPNATTVSAFETTNDSKDIWYSGSANFNYKRVLDTLGSEWTVDLDYAAYGNNTQQLFTTRYYNLDHNEYQPAYLLGGDIVGNLSIYSIKTDVHKELGKDRSLDAGLKSSYVIADNNLQFFDQSSGVPVYDSTKSNHFIYKENINAGYVSYSQKIGKWMIQLGLRAEHTAVSGKQLVYNVTNDTNYLQLFPTAYLTYQLNEKNSIEINYARRIDRPGYDQLNPFKFYLDPSTYKEGNPYLRPQTTHVIEIAHLWNNSIYTQLGVGKTLDNITEVIAPSLTQQNITVQTNTNLKSAEIIYFNASVPIPVTKWWTTTNNLNSYVALYSGNVANTTINRQGSFAFNVQTSNQFTIGKTWTLEVNADYRSKELYAFDRINDFWSFGLGAQKKILQNRGTIRLNITDIFFTNYTTANVKFTDYTEYFDVKRETRVATLSFTYKFGKTSVSANRRRAGGADDLKSRVNNPGGG